MADVRKKARQKVSRWARVRIRLCPGRREEEEEEKKKGLQAALRRRRGKGQRAKDGKEEENGTGGRPNEPLPTDTSPTRL